MHNHDRFSRTVEDYRRYRPDYPAALFDWLLPHCGLEPGSTVVDVGCGTGISSRPLAARGVRVFGVDPNGPMLAAAREAGGGVSYVQSDAETLTVPVDTVDAIVGGQSFHWIDLPRATPRFKALLRPGGRVVAFWNLRDHRDPFMKAYEALLLEWSPEYASVGAEPRARAVAAQVDAEHIEFGHGQVLDRPGFGGRVWSSSYVRNVVADRAGFDAALDALFAAHATGGHVRFVYRTHAWSWRP